MRAILETSKKDLPQLLHDINPFRHYDNVLRGHVEDTTVSWSPVFSEHILSLSQTSDTLVKQLTELIDRIESKYSLAGNGLVESAITAD